MQVEAFASQLLVEKIIAEVGIRLLPVGINEPSAVKTVYRAAIPAGNKIHYRYTAIKEGSNNWASVSFVVESAIPAVANRLNVVMGFCNQTQDNAVFEQSTIIEPTDLEGDAKRLAHSICDWLLNEKLPS